MEIIGFKVTVALVLALLGAATLRSRHLDLMSESRFLQVAIALQTIPVASLFVALYIVGHQEVTSDVPSYYVPAARAVLAGQLPFRDFTLSYAPLFAYVGAALISLWNSGKVFALFAIVLNALALLPWHFTCTACFDRETARRATILYAASGHLAIQALLGTNQAWIAAALACSALFVVQNRNAAAGLVQAFALCATKFLVLLFWPVLWICATRRIAWISVAAVASALVYGTFALAGGDLLDPLRHESGLISSGNLPYLLEPLLSVRATLAYRLSDGLTFIVLAATMGWIYSRARTIPAALRPKLVLVGVALTGLAFMLISKKSFTGYAVFFMYPVLAVFVRTVATLRVRVIFLMVFNALLVSEPSIWFHAGGDGLPLSEWLHRSNPPGVVGFILLDLALVSCYGFLALACVRCLRGSPQDFRQQTARST